MLRVSPVRFLSTVVASVALSACVVVPPADENATKDGPDMNDERPVMDDDLPDMDDDVPPVSDDEEPIDDVEEPTGPRRFTVRLSNIAPWTYFKSGVFNTPVGRASPGAIHPGDAYEVTFTAGSQHRLSFVTMLGASNDWFYGTPPEGIALYNDGVPLSDDVTSLLRLYDAGSEIDEEPAVGASTGPKQGEPTAGAADPVGFVRALQNPIYLSDGSTFSLPELSDVLHVTIAPVGERTFRLRIENVSAEGALVTSEGARDIGLSPGVWVMHTTTDPLFTIGQADRGQGLELIAESGRVQMLGDYLASSSGVATGFSPAVYVVHDRGMPLFTVDQPDRGQGLEEIAESGNVSLLDEELGTAFPEGASAKGVVNMTEGSDAPGPLRPGQSYSFSVMASPGDRLSFASMFGVSNDWIVATPDTGVALFDANGAALSGDFTGDLHFYDVGTEIDEEPAVGAHTGPNQSAPDDGPADAIGTVRVLAPTLYALPAAAHLALSISAE